MLETFTAQTFKPLVGDLFTLSPGDTAPLAVELFEVTEFEQLGPASAAGGPPRQPFSLLFRGPRDVALAQRIYPLEHATLGAFELFLVPIGVDAAGMRYQAVFT